MEIELKNIKIGRTAKSTLTIPSKLITAITGEYSDKLVNVLRGNLKGVGGKVIYDNKVITATNQYDIKRKISYIEEYFDYKDNYESVEEYMLSIFLKEKIKIKDPHKKIIDSLKIVNLSSQLLKRNILTLSDYEKKCLQIAIALLSNPKIIILEEPFIQFDAKNIQRIMRLLMQLSEKYQISIIVKTNDSEIIYRYIKYVIIIKSDKKILEGYTKEIYSNIENLKKYDIEIPDIVEFVYKAKKNKNAIIDYHRDIRDLIKYIYKHI